MYLPDLYHTGCAYRKAVPHTQSRVNPHICAFCPVSIKLANHLNSFIQITLKMLMDSSNFKVRQTHYTNSEWTELYLFVSEVCKQYRSIGTEQCLCAYAGVLNQCSEVWSGNMIHSDFRQHVWFGEEGKSSFKLVWALQVTFFLRTPPPSKKSTTKPKPNQKQQHPLPLFQLEKIPKCFTKNGSRLDTTPWNMVM